VLAFAAQQGQGRLSAADASLLLAVASASIGYVAGARVSALLPAEQVICWVLVCSLPLTLPAMLATWPAQAASVRAASWVGFGYVTLFSMWLGFFAWYRGLVLGGVMRVSQVQLLQPFLALLAAVPLLGEKLDAATVLFALAVAAVVFVGKRMPVRARMATGDAS
jgi:drug/metabolite transporter (DMT)-like permease